MSTDRWARLEELYHAARVCPPAEQARYLADACAGDAALRDEVLSLLARTPANAAAVATTVAGGTTLVSGATLSHFRIEERLASGGMGDVFRALDTRLNRSVAIKVSRAAFSLRFRREAQVLASLTHPHICTLYDVGPDYLVMELVDGETLADRIARGPLPGPEVLRLGTQVADALAQAHAQGITHRDLKPGNVMLTRNGVKVLDFGLASLDDQSITLTHVGAVLGTPAYMAPEQREGRNAGPQTDIFALGLLLYEMATGKRPGLRPGEPVVVAGLPEPLAHVVRRCLAEEPVARWRTAAEISALLEFGRLATDALPTTTRRSRRVVHVVWATLLVAVASVALYGSRFVRAPVSAPTRTVDLVTPPEADAGGLALSPDGTQFAYTGLRNGVARLFVRTLENGLVKEIAGTDGAALPFWSPDGRSLAFFAESQLKRLEVQTGAVRRLADATLSPAGGTWSKDGVILFSPNIGAGVYRVSETGAGDVTLLVNQGMSPKFLDDGQHFLFNTGARVFVASLNDPAGKPLGDANVALPGPAGYLLVVRQGNLYAQRLDPKRLQLAGAEIPLRGRVSVSSDGASASVTASSNGGIALRDLSVSEQLRSIGWFDRRGVESKRVSDRGGASPTLSPDETLLAFSGPTADGRQGVTVWLQETAGGVLDQFPSGRFNQTALFSPDGRAIAFSTSRNGFVELFTKPIAGGDEKPVFDPPKNTDGTVASDWKGDYLLYRENSPVTKFDIWAVRLSGRDRTPQVVVKTPDAERDAQFSPDMRWIAYESNKSGSSEIYMTRFPKPGREFRISTQGGAQVRWNPGDQDELFYVALDGRLVAVRLQFGPDRETVRSVEEAALFQTRIGVVVQGAQKQQYVVSRDGQRFLVSSVKEDTLTRITLIENWKPPSN